MCAREFRKVEKAGQAARPIYSTLLPGISIRPPVPSPVDSFPTFAFDHFLTRTPRDLGYIANRDMALRGIQRSCPGILSKRVIKPKRLVYVNQLESLKRFSSLI